MNYNLNSRVYFWRTNDPGPFQFQGNLFSTKSLENISNTPKQCSSVPRLCLNFSAYFFLFPVCTCPLEMIVALGDAAEWQRDSEAAGQGDDWEERHMWSRWFLWFPYEGQPGHSGTQRTVVCAASLHLWSCLSGKVSFCLCCREVEGAFNKYARWAIRSLELWRSWGILHTTILGRLCCDYFMSWPRCLFAGCWQ